MRKLLFVFFIILFLFGCAPQEKIKHLDVLDSEYVIYDDEMIDFKEIIDFDGNVEISCSSDIIDINNSLVSGVKSGECEIEVKVNDEIKVIKIIIRERANFTVEDIEIYRGDKKQLNIDIIKGNEYDLILEKENNKINILDNNIIEGVEAGVCKVTVTLDNVCKDITVTIKDWDIEVLNENFDVDIFETLEIKLKYPEVCKDMIIFDVSKESILKIENNTIIPLKAGNTRVKVMIGENSDYSTSFTVNVTIDPIKIISSFHNEEALMKKEITLYGSSEVKQSLLGSVSRYMFDDLNLENRIIDIYDNPYVGLTATKEIVEALDRKGYPRSGVKMESISYITYHDTGNSAAGADALSNANWMTNQYSVTTSARSWHYTVDQNRVIQSIPDDEITFQGDHYDAYTKSIGIETCVNAGANMDKIWHRMGKLCAKLMVTYGLEVDDIKQHYYWNQKNCPQTLRRNNLYSYAISLVEAELVARKYLYNYKIEFESLSPEYLDNTGQIIKAPEAEIIVSYKVTISNSKGYNESVTLSTKVKPLS